MFAGPGYISELLDQLKQVDFVLDDFMIRDHLTPFFSARLDEHSSTSATPLFHCTRRLIKQISVSVRLSLDYLISELVQLLNLHP